MPTSGQCGPPLQENGEVHERMSADLLHAQAEALRLAFADALQFCADPAEPGSPDPARLLDKERAAARWSKHFRRDARADNVSPDGVPMKASARGEHEGGRGVGGARVCRGRSP